MIEIVVPKEVDTVVSIILPVLFIVHSNTATLFCTRWCTVTSYADEIISFYLTQAQK